MSALMLEIIGLVDGTIVNRPSKTIKTNHGHSESWRPDNGQLTHSILSLKEEQVSFQGLLDVGKQFFNMLWQDRQPQKL